MTTSPDLLKSPDEPPVPSATLGGESKRSIEQIALLLFITVPFVALLAAVPLAWGWGSAGSISASSCSCTTWAATA